MTDIADIGTINSRRLDTPGPQAWEKGIGRDATERYLTVTVDSHVSEAADVYTLGGLDPKYLPRVPHIVVDDEGRHLMMVEGFDRPQLLKGRPKGGEYEERYERDGLNTGAMMWSDRIEPDDLLRMRAAATQIADEPTLSRIRADLYRDGVDGAVVFANRGQLSFATHDADFAHAMCHAWSVWAWETYGGHRDQFRIAAQLAMADPETAVREVEWLAETGFHVANISCKPLYGDRPDDITYNHPQFDPVWAALEASGMTVCMHVATGRDPRAATGSGGAIINKAVGFLRGTMEPLAALLASGVFQRFPGLKFVTVEADIGWIPWFLESLDLAYYKHHMWVRPTLDEPPSHYWYTNCAASMIEDSAGLYMARDFKLLDNIMWSNDYPHHEGTWPHSVPAMERQLGQFTEEERSKLLGFNAVRWFGFDAEKLLALRATPPDPALGTIY